MREFDPEQEIDLRDLLKVLAKRRQLIATFFAVLFTVVLVGVFTATPRYEAETRLLVERSAPNPLDPQYRLLPEDRAFLETQHHLIKGLNVARKVVDKLSLDSRYATSFLGEEDGWLAAMLLPLKNLSSLGGGPDRGIEDREAKSKADKIADILSEDLKVEPLRNSNIITISYLSENPVLARMVVNTVAKAYMEELLEIRMQASGYAIKWMSEKSSTERAKLEKTERALQQYTRENDIVTVENRIAIIPKKLEEFSSQLSIAESRKKELEALYQKTREAKGNLSLAETIPGISANASLQTLREEILKAEQNIMELSKKYGRKHPAMIAAKDELSVLMDKRAQEIGRLVESIKSEYELAVANVENLEQLLAKTKQEAQTLNEKYIQYGILKREVDSNRVMFDALIRGANEQMATEQTQNINVWVVTEAKTPEKPARPRKLLILALGGLFGILGGVGLAFFIEFLDNTVSDPAEAEARLGATVLGVVEQYREDDIEQAVISRPMSPFAESYKTLRSALMLSSADRPPRTILVSSTSPGEGKTTTATNLALAIAQSENRVLLIDADLRRPRIHKMYRLPNRVGLSTYLAGTSDEKEIVQPSSLDNLKIITAGPAPPNPSELLSSQRFREWLKKGAEEYDFIIIDSAPLLSAADSLVLSKAVDGTLVVARAGKATYEALAHAIKSLKGLDSHLLGMVINGIDLKKSQYGRYYGYYNYYSSDLES